MAGKSGSKKRRPSRQDVIVEAQTGRKEKNFSAIARARRKAQTTDSNNG